MALDVVNVHLLQDIRQTKIILNIWNLTVNGCMKEYNSKVKVKRKRIPPASSLIFRHHSELIPNLVMSVL